MFQSRCCPSSKQTRRNLRSSATPNLSNSTPRAICIRCWASNGSMRRPEALRSVSRPGMHIHLDAVGGVAGDMFIAAMLDAFPDQRNGMLAAIRSAGLPAEVHIGFTEHQDHALTGLRFRVIEPRATESVVTRHHHAHTSFSEIRAHLRGSALSPAVRDHAI